mmetsp:Transcript_21416/g.46287  ORF Transcript_21416/g.46287 Transcript_21416/m.46287 type:complete len:105 (+) Transcript_21416:258-572(+)
MAPPSPRRSPRRAGAVGAVGVGTGNNSRENAATAVSVLETLEGGGTDQRKAVGSRSQQQQQQLLLHVRSSPSHGNRNLPRQRRSLPRRSDHAPLPPPADVIKGQ